MTKLFYKILICLFFLGCDAPAPDKADKEPLASVAKDTSLKPILSIKFREGIQVFQITTKKEQIIRGKMGTVITIPKECFGVINPIVKFELIECYSIQDMLLNGLTTLTKNGKLLETEGMIYLNALSENDDTLKVVEGRIQVEMVTEQAKEGYDLFTGLGADGNVMWVKRREKVNSATKRIDSFFYKPISIEKDDLWDSTRQEKTQKNNGELIFNDGKTYEIEDQQLINYSFLTTNLGWLNIDKFRELPSSYLIVDVAPAYHDASYYIVLKNYNSILYNGVGKSATANGNISFENVPESEPFTLLGFGARDGELFFYMEDYSSNTGHISFPPLKPITRQEMNDKLLEKFGKNIWNRPSA